MLATVFVSAFGIQLYVTFSASFRTGGMAYSLAIIGLSTLAPIKYGTPLTEVYVNLNVWVS